MPPKKKPQPAAPLKVKPQGTGGRKRTPSGAFDAAAGKDTYEPEKVIVQRLGKGVTQYLVKWANYDSKDGDLQKSAKDSTLEHSLFAAFNPD